MDGLASLGLGNELVGLADERMRKINSLKPKPLIELESDDVFLRTMKLTGDRLNAYFGKFRTSDLGKIADMSKGAPVLVGHRKDSRPVGRIYDGFVEEGFVLTPFYVPVARSDARDLITDIDTGVASEASISFQFETPTCGICGHDMRSMDCSHWPGENGAFYYYDGVTMVLEGSIVYRGAHPETGFRRLMRVDTSWGDKFDRFGKVDSSLPKRRAKKGGGYLLVRS